MSSKISNPLLLIEEKGQDEYLPYLFDGILIILISLIRCKNSYLFPPLRSLRTFCYLSVDYVV